MNDDEREVLRRRLSARIYGLVERGANRNETLEANGLLSEKVVAQEAEWHRSDEYDWIEEHVGDAGDDALLAAFERLYPEATWEFSETPWTPGRFRLFASHSSKDRRFVADVRSAVQPFGIDLFVAHEDIEPSREWLRVIEYALSSCHALIAFLTEHFRPSPWTDQEVGIVYGRGVPVLPLMLGQTPYGFMGKFQGLRGDHAEEVANEVLSAILRQDSAWPKLAEAMVNQVEDAGSYDDAKLAVAQMRRLPALPSWLADSLRFAEKYNGQVDGRQQRAGISDVLQRLV